MGAQFTCGNSKRRLRILNKTPDGDYLNGIDYLEVLDRAAPPDSPPQRTLLLRLFQPVPVELTAQRVRISGGTRLRSIAVEWALPANAVSTPPATPSEVSLFAALPQPDHVLVVRTASFGDFSSYTLSLDMTPAERFDPVLSTVEYSFKVECPSDFDCEQKKECPPASVAPPPIDYLAKDFSSLRRVLFDRLSVLMPDWRERNAADVQVMLLELLAYAGDHLSYYQDAVGTEAYLGTARRRASVRRHARLLDYFVHEGTSSRAWVCVEVDANGVQVKREPPGQPHTAFLSRCVADPRIDPAKYEQVLREFAPEVFEPLHDAVLYRAHNRIDFYTWGDEECCLPKGVTRATLKDPAADRLRLRPGDVLIFEDWFPDGVPTFDPLHPMTTCQVAASSPAPSRRQAVRLLSVTPSAQVPTQAPDAPRTPDSLTKDPLTGDGFVEIEWHPEDALRFPLCVSKRKTPDDELKVMGLARGNVILVEHGRTVTESLPPLPASGNYRPRLSRTEITHAVPYDHQAAQADPAALVMAQEPHAALAAVRLEGTFGPWLASRDLLSADSFTSAFVVEMEEDGSATLRFGDGVLGRKPAANLTARYRIGRGPAGNVGAETITHIVSADPGISCVRNPLPAAGGVPPESIESVRQYAPQAFRTQERAVTEADYAAAAERHPEVQKATATRLWTGSFYTVFVTIDRSGGRPLDEKFRDSLRNWMERFQLAGEDLEVDAPRFVPLDLQLVVCLAAGYFRADVQEALLRAFSASDLPDGTRGFFHPDNFTFGQPVYLSQVVRAAMQVPGVNRVELDPQTPDFLFQRFGVTPQGEKAEGQIAMGRLEIARLDNSLSEPENGRFRIKFKGAA